jgi:hypothetical protein
MQSAVPQGRNLVSVSSSGAISIDPAATGQAGAAGSTRTAVDIGKVLDEITDALQNLLTVCPQPTATSQGPSLFSAHASLPSATLGPIHNSLDGVSQKLSAALSEASATASAPATATGPSQADPDWPYPDLGPSPFMSNPTGSGPTGSFNFNPTYFPTEATSEAIARMVGGKVVAQNVMLTAPGSHFGQNQPNYMVELPNGNVFNPGFIAQAISVKQPRTTIDAMIYSEMNNTAVSPGDAPPFVPVNASQSGTTSATQAPLSSQSTPSSGWSSVDQLATHLSGADAAGSTRERMQSIVRMLQLLSKMNSISQSIQPGALNMRSLSQ